MKARSIFLITALVALALLFTACAFPDTNEHTWVDATCTAPKTCADCGATEGEPLGHTEETIAGKAATCTEAGLTEGKKCSVCGEILVAQEEIPAEHTEETVPGKAATCTETGLTEGKKCTVCGETLVAQEEISSLGHKDEDGNFECDVCKAELCVDHTPAAAIVENNKPATCEKAGSYESVVKCSICGDEISRETVVLDKLPHTEETVAGKAATCTETGLTDGKKCAVCGEILVAQEETDKLPHSEETVPGKAATCTEKGLTDGKKCAVCGETLVAQEETDKLPHSEETVPGKAATCTEKGLTDGKKCAVCGEILVAQEEIPAGHTITDGVCSVCGYIENIFAGKVFIPTEEAAAQVLSASWWKGGGYNVLTDGQRTEEGAGRFSTLMNNTTVFMDATINLAGAYDLDTIRFYLYDTQDTLTEDSKKASVGKDMLLQIYADGKWIDVVSCADNAALCEHLVINDGLNNDYLEFDLQGVAATRIRFFISGGVATSGITFQEITCDGVVSETLAPETERVFADNLFAGKTFTPTADAAASVLSASWWKGSGYAGLTDGIKNADNAPGRFSTVMATTDFMDATTDFGGSYELHTMKFYIYEVNARTEAQIKGSIGTDMLIQVYANGKWQDVITCADNAALYGHLVSNEGLNNDYLAFDLGGIAAEKVRFYISGSASGTGTTYEEIECSGYTN